MLYHVVIGRATREKGDQMVYLGLLVGKGILSEEHDLFSPKGLVRCRGEVSNCPLGHREVWSVPFYCRILLALSSVLFGAILRI